MRVRLTLVPVVRCQLKPSFAIPIGFEHRRPIIAESFCCRCCCSVGHGTPLLAHTLPKLTKIEPAEHRSQRPEIHQASSSACSWRKDLSAKPRPRETSRSLDKSVLPGFKRGVSHSTVHAPSRLYLPGPTKMKTIMIQNISVAREYCVKLWGCSRKVDTAATSIVSA